MSPPPECACGAPPIVTVLSTQSTHHSAPRAVGSSLLINPGGRVDEEWSPLAIGDLWWHSPSLGGGVCGGDPGDVEFWLW